MRENENLLEETVFPSEEKTIELLFIDDEYGGAHHYKIKKCIGFENGQTRYCSGDKITDFHFLPFVHKINGGTVTDGLQNEQLIIVLKDRIKKLNAKFPHPENENMIIALDLFLEASKRRVEERMDRGVMGELKK